MRPNEILRLASKINFLGIQSYLKNTGWVRQASNRDDVAVFTLNRGSEEFEIVLPLNREFVDYDKGILNAVSTIASFEDKEIPQVLSDLALPPADVLRFRLVNRDTEEGTITFDDGFSLLKNARMSLYTSACDILQPEFYHRRLAFKGADQFIEQCRLGQTERGSFIASVICPFVAQIDGQLLNQLTLFDTPQRFSTSLTRKVTSNLVHSVQRVKLAIERDKVNDLIDPGVPNKISANFLQSIVDLSEVEGQPNTELEIIPTWAAVISEQDLPRSVMLSQEYVPAIKSIIQQLAPKDETDPGEFIGRISQVKAEPDVSRRKEGEITFNFIGDNEQIVKAKVVLTADDYNLACEAHEHGRTVRIKGVLLTADRTRIIQNPTFEILS